VLELAEEALDEVALAVDRGIYGALEFAVLLRGDVGAAAARADQLDHRLSVVAAVGDQRLGGWQPVDQLGDGGLVGGLAGREHDPERQSVLVH